MLIDFDEGKIQREHEDMLALAEKNSASPKFIHYCRRQVTGHWKRFAPKIGIFSKPISGSVFLEYGCKFGHMIPLIMSQGVSRIHAIDVMDEHVNQGREFFGAKYPVEYSLSDKCLIDVPSSTVDFVLVNEVISHINPAFLNNFYAEVARVLKVGGEIAISDGNNSAHLKTRLDLLRWYSLWENGMSKEFKDRNYFSLRVEMIAKEFPDLDKKTVEYLARNTSGMFGNQIRESIHKYLSGGTFVERPYRDGMCPTHPVFGVVMERAFHPNQVLLALDTYGISAVQLLRGVPVETEAQRGETKNFTIRGTKLADDVDVLSNYTIRNRYNDLDDFIEPQKIRRTLEDNEIALISGAECLAELRADPSSESMFRNTNLLENKVDDIIAKLVNASIAAFDGGRLAAASEIIRKGKLLFPRNELIAEKFASLQDTLKNNAEDAEANDDFATAFDNLDCLVNVAPENRKILKCAQRVGRRHGTDLDNAQSFALSINVWRRMLQYAPDNETYLGRYIRAAIRSNKLTEAAQYIESLGIVRDELEWQQKFASPIMQHTEKLMAEEDYFAAAKSLLIAKKLAPLIFQKEGEASRCVVGLQAIAERADRVNDKDLTGEANRFIGELTS